MNLLTSLFIKAPVQSFAQGLVDDIVKRYPPALDSQPGKRPSATRLTRIVEDACNKAIAFQEQYRLGWLGKAIFGNKFRWALREKGYQNDFVELATEAVIVLISQPHKHNAPTPQKKD